MFVGEASSPMHCKHGTISTYDLRLVVWRLSIYYVGCVISIVAHSLITSMGRWYLRLDSLHGWMIHRNMHFLGEPHVLWMLLTLTVQVRMRAACQEWFDRIEWQRASRRTKTCGLHRSLKTCLPVISHGIVYTIITRRRNEHDSDYTELYWWSGGVVMVRWWWSGDV